MPYNSRRHDRRSIRLLGYDYTQVGVYFVTICTAHHAPVLGRVVGGSFEPSPIGALVAACWCALPGHFTNLTLDTWVLMPDHVHGIIVLSGTAASYVLSTKFPAPNGTRPNSLGAIIQNFKSVSTRRANTCRRVCGEQLRQRNYDESIIRHARHLAAARQYIERNPKRWPQARRS